jgi:phenylacetate-CoA ligase
MAVKNTTGDFFDDLEIMSAGARARYFEQKLSQTMRRSYRHAPAVKNMLDKAGINPARIRSIKDLDKIPITRKMDLIELQKSAPPFGGFSAVAPEKIDRIFISPGPIYEPIQAASIRWFAKSFYAAGFRNGDVVVNTFTYHMSPAGILFHEALRDCGATVIPMGIGNTEILIQTMADLKVSGFVGTPSFLMIVFKRAEELGRDIGHDFAVKRAWFTGEMLAPSLREIFEKDYHISTFQTYAVTETGGALAYECCEKSGMHLMDEYIVEIVDPGSGRQLGPGEMGEVVVTPVHNKAWGIIRFGTGDISSYTTETCPCGRTANRLTGILGRTGDAVKVRGMFVVSRQAEQIILGFEPVSRFQIVVTNPDQRDEMTLKLELKRGASAGEKNRLAEDLNNKFRDVCRVRIDKFDFLEAGVIPEKCPKIVDRRTWK